LHKNHPPRPCLDKSRARSLVLLPNLRRIYWQKRRRRRGRGQDVEGHHRSLHEFIRKEVRVIHKGLWLLGGHGVIELAREAKQARAVGHVVPAIQNTLICFWGSASVGISATARDQAYGSQRKPGGGVAEHAVGLFCRMSEPAVFSKATVAWGGVSKRLPAKRAQSQAHPQNPWLRKNWHSFCRSSRLSSAERFSSSRSGAVESMDDVEVTDVTEDRFTGLSPRRTGAVASMVMAAGGAGAGSETAVLPRSEFVKQKQRRLAVGSFRGASRRRRFNRQTGFNLASVSRRAHPARHRPRPTSDRRLRMPYALVYYITWKFFFFKYAPERQGYKPSGRCTRASRVSA